MKTLVFTMLLLCSIIFAPRSFGQASDGNIVGTVLDATGAVVSNANVELANVATGVKNTARTDSNGAYRFGNVLVGTYAITVTAQGFTTLTLKDVQVELSRTTTVNLNVTVGAVATQIEVSESAVLIDSTTAQITNT